MTTQTARDLLALEQDYCDIDQRLKRLARFTQMTGVDGAERAAQRVRQARKYLAKTLWVLSAAITDAVNEVEWQPDEDIPF